MRRSVLQKVPPGIPKVLEPINLKKINFDALEKNIEKSMLLFSDIVQNTQYRWWNRYIGYLKETAENKDKLSFYAKKNARWLLPLLPMQNPTHQVPNLVPAELHEMVDREIDDPEVSI